MYIVANITNNTISLSDLNLTIPPNQSRDLHQLKLDIKPEKSEHLKIAIGKKYLKVIKRDMKAKKHSENVQPTQSSMDEKSLTKIIREELKGLKSNTEPPKEVNQNEVMQQMLIMMQQMKDMVKNQQSSGVKNDSYDVDYDDIDLEQLSKIHAKAVKKLTENVENSIDYEKETTKDSNLASRADELSDIL